VTQVYGTCPDRRPTTPTHSAAICTAHKKGGFSPEQEGLRKQKQNRKDEHLLDNIIFFDESKLARNKKHPFIKHIPPLEACVEKRRGKD